jgi:uncharacterized protein
MTFQEIKYKITPILKQHKVKRAGVFGSYAKNLQCEDSDVDILVELGNEMSLFDFVRIKLDIEDQLQKSVDLVEYKAIKPRLKDRILSEEIRIYG